MSALTLSPQVRNRGALTVAEPSSWPASLLLLSLLIPWLVSVGPVTMMAYRAVLLVLIGPCIVAWLTGRAGRVVFPDIAVLLFCVWTAIGLFIVHGGSEGLEGGGVTFIETFGGYLVARCYVQSQAQFLAMVKTLFFMVLCLMPFAAIEALTGYNLGRALFAAVLPTYQPETPDAMRAGMTRAMVVLDHPILFGVFTGSLLGLVHLVLGRTGSSGRRWTRSAVVIVTCFFSLSSAPIGALVLQMLLVGWNWLLRAISERWLLLWLLAAGIYVAIDLASNQNPMQVYVARFTFNQQSAWYRFLIWDYGLASIANHPWFGVGFGEWAHPSFMTFSVDNFWLLLSMRHGLPAGTLMYSAILFICLRVGFARQPDVDRENYRVAYLITMVAFITSAWSVHLWGAPYVLLMFLAGSGIWFYQALPAGDIAVSPRTLPTQRQRLAPRLRHDQRISRPRQSNHEQ